MDVLTLSYKHLPDHLKVCFIYFGVFPEDFEFPVWKLLRLWVSEVFVRESGQECLDDIAEEYLEDLVDRNLVLVVKKRANGRIKTCPIHDMLRDLCMKEGRKSFCRLSKALYKVIHPGLQSQVIIVDFVSMRTYWILYLPSPMAQMFGPSLVLAWKRRTSLDSIQLSYPKHLD